MEKIIKGRSWKAWTDGKDYMASLWRGDGEVHAVGFWWIDKRTFDKLPQMDFPEDVKAIIAGKCIYTYANIRSTGVAIRIFDKDWKKLTAWEDLPYEVSEYGENGDYVMDYPAAWSTSAAKQNLLLRLKENWDATSTYHNDAITYAFVQCICFSHFN